MRILLVTHYYSTHRGGIEIVAGKLAAMLARQHEVVWAASNCDALPEAAAPSLRFTPMRATNAIERFTGLPFPIWGPRSLVRLWRETRAADVVHLHDLAYFGNWAAFAFARLHRKPVLVTQHVGFIPYRNPFLRFALRAMHATVGPLVLGRAEHVVFISQVVHDYYARFISFRRPAQVVLNGVDSETFAPDSQGGRVAARHSLGLDPSRPVLLFVGRFVEKKGLAILEALARRMTDVSWVFAGWGPLDPRTWNAPHVHVFHDRREADLVPLYQTADLLVLPSVGEGLPLVVQESMSCGTPALVGEDTARAVGAPPELAFACAVNGLRSVDAWEASIRRILADLGASTDRRKAVADFARASWSWTACADRYSILLAQIASRDQPAHHLFTS